LTISLRFALELAGLLGTAFFPENKIGLVEHLSPNLLIDIWVRWDAIHYYEIAQGGYHAGADNLAFFPLLPVLMKLFAPLFKGDLVMSGLAIATVTFAAALFYLYKLVALDFDAETAGRTILYLAIAPMSFYFLSIYTEPLFLLLSVGSIYHARRNRWIVAALMGALAVLTRPVGLLLIIPLGLLALQLWWKNKRNVFPALSLSALPAALLGWMFYMQRLTGNPLAFVKAQSGSSWHRTTDVPWNTILDAFDAILHQPFESYYRSQYGVDLAATLILLGAAIFAFGYLPRIYSLYLAGSVVFLLTSRSDIQVLFSMPRFAMVLFPVFILLALAGKNPLVDRFILIAFPVLLGLYMALFAQWYWIA
jgi:hypothetical protein